MTTNFPPTDFIVIRSDPVEFQAVSAAAKRWLAESGKAEPDAADIVRRDRASSLIFLEALSRKGFTCLDSGGSAMVSPASLANSGQNAFGLGCSTLAAMVFLIPAGAVVYGVNWVFGPAVAAVLAFIAIILVAAAVVSAKQQQTGEEADRANLASLNFAIDAFTSLGGGSFIAIDQRGRRLAIKTSGSLYLRDFQTVIGAEIEEDGSSVQRSNRGSQMEGALIGSVLAGPVGLLVGGLSGSKRIEQKAHALTLNVFTTDVRVSTIKVPMFKAYGGISVSSGLYIKKRQQAQDWYSRISAAVKA